MQGFKNVIILALLALTASWGLVACGGANCGDGTKENEDGMCVPIEQLSCAEGTTKADGKCVVGDKGCATGTQFDSDSQTCIPSAETCDMEGTSFDSETGKCVAIDWCADGTIKDGNSCVPDCGDTAMVNDDGKCVADVAKVCATMGGAVRVQDGVCTIAEAACAAGTSLSANGNCVIGEEACGDGLVLADSGKCAPTGDVCDSGTTFDEDQGLCLPEATCQMGDVILNGVCASPAEELAANADHAESENNDPTMGGMANAITVKMTGMATAFTGTIEAPRDIDGDGSMDQDRDTFSLTASTGDWFKVSVQSTGLQSPFFMISGPDGYERWASTGSPSGAARFFVAPTDGDYSITVMPKELALDSDVGPIGSADSTYVGSLEKLATPSPTAKDMSMGDQTLTGTASDLTDNLFDLQNLAQSDIYELKAMAAAADGDLVLQIWSDPTTLETTIDPLDAGATHQLSSIMGNRLVLVDWKSAWGPSLDFEISAANIGTSTNPTIAAGMSNSQMITVTPFTTVEIEQTNMGGEDLDIEILDSMGNAVDSDTVGSGDTFATLLKQPGTYTVEVTNNTMSSLSPTVKVIQVPPVDFGTLSTTSPSKTSQGTVEGGGVVAVKFELNQGEIAEIYYDADSVSDEFDAELFDASATSVVPEIDLDPISDTSLDEDSYGLYTYADTTATYYALLSNPSSFTSLDGIEITGWAKSPLALGSGLMQGDTASVTVGTSVSRGLSEFATLSTMNNLGMIATGTPAGSTDSSLLLRDSSFTPGVSDEDTANPTLDNVPLGNGMSFVQIRADSGDLQSGYKLDAEFVTPPIQEMEPNDTEMNAQPMTFGAKHVAQIESGNVDYWSVDLQSALGANEVLMLEARGPYNFDDWECELLDSSSTSLKTITDKEEGCTILADGLSAGTYYFKVTMSDSTNEDYNLYANRNKGTLETEPNDMTSSANSITYADWSSDTPIYGEAPSFSDTDYFEITLSSAQPMGQLLVVNFENVGQEKETLELDMQDSMGNSVESTSSDGGFLATGLAAGTYYLMVDGGSSSNDNQYRISAQTVTYDQSVSASPGQMFPDNTPAGISSSVSVSNCMTVTDLSIDVDFSHEDWQDIHIVLTNPTGTAVTMKLGDVDGGSGTTWVKNIPLEYPSANPVDPFLMSGGNGMWTINVSDRQVDTGSDDGSGGTFNQWTLNLGCQ